MASITFGDIWIEVQERYLDSNKAILKADALRWANDTLNDINHETDCYTAEQNKVLVESTQALTLDTAPMRIIAAYYWENSTNNIWEPLDYVSARNWFEEGYSRKTSSDYEGRPEKYKWEPGSTTLTVYPPPDSDSAGNYIYLLYTKFMTALTGVSSTVTGIEPAELQKSVIVPKILYYAYLQDEGLAKTQEDRAFFAAKKNSALAEWNRNIQKFRSARNKIGRRREKVLFEA